MKCIQTVGNYICAASDGIMILIRFNFIQWILLSLRKSSVVIFREKLHIIGCLVKISGGYLLSLGMRLNCMFIRLKERKASNDLQVAAILGRSFLINCQVLHAKNN